MVNKERHSPLANRKIASLFLVFILLVLGLMAVANAATVSIVVPGSATVLNGATQLLNGTFTQSGGINVTNYTWYYSTDSGATWTNIFSTANSTLLNGTGSTGNGTASTLNATWDTTGVTDSTSLVINLTANLTNGTRISTTIASIALDNTVPNATASFVDDNNDAFTNNQVPYGEDVNIRCTPGDDTSGINTTSSTISIKYPGLSTYENLSLSENSATQLQAVLKGKNTEKLGDYSVRCYTQDFGGSTNTSELNFTVISKIVTGTGAAAIPGFEMPVGKVKVGTGTVEDAGRLTVDGDSRLVKKGGAVRFDIKGESHKVEVVDATDKKVTLKVYSDPIDVEIEAGETKSVDVNGDGEADIEITYHKLFAKTYADLTFKEVSKPAEEELEADGEETMEDMEEESYKPAKGGLTVTLAVVVIILIIGFALIKGKKK